MVLLHKEYTDSGRLFSVVGEPTKLVYKAGLGVKNIEESPGVFVPHVIDEAAGTVRFADLVASLPPGGGMQIKRGTDIIGSFSFHPEFNSGTTWEREPILRSKVRIKKVSTLEHSDIAVISIDLATASQKLTIDANFSAHTTVKFSMRMEAKRDGRHRIVLDRPKKLKSKRLLDKIGRVIGHEDDKGRWSWEKAETVDHILDETDPGKIRVRIKEGLLATGEVRLISPDTFGPTGISGGNDDCQESNDTSVSLGGLDSDGDVIGGRSSSSYDMAMRWLNVPPVSGNTISSAHFDPFLKFVSGSAPLATIQGVKESNPNDWSLGTRPSQRVQTTSTVAWNPPTAPDETRMTSPDISSIIQEIIDGTSHTATQAMALIWKDNGSGANDFVQYQDYNNQPANSAQLTIVFTVGGGGPTITLPQVERHYPRGNSRGLCRGLA